jgi:hypothetical protein
MLAETQVLSWGFELSPAPSVDAYLVEQVMGRIASALQKIKWASPYD